MPPFPCEEKSFLIGGPAGAIEIATRCPEIDAGTFAVLCHPHPQHGGTMHNKVIVTLARALVELGVSCIRFNFRGVGKSTGTFDNAIGEVEDLIAVVDWSRQELPGYRLWLVGFSFGATVALRASQNLRPDGLITVAPAVNLHDVEDIHPQAAHWLLVQGEQDEIVPSDRVNRWAKARTRPPSIEHLPGVGHFFHKKLNVLHGLVQSHCRSWLADLT
jgi:uncharacterized protein